MDKKKGLGRGLESLFAIYDNEEPAVSTNETKPTAPSTNKTNGVTEIDVFKIIPNPNQPRKHFDEEALQELASSIKLHGVIQPLVVNKSDNDQYLIIAGERRW